MLRSVPRLLSSVLSKNNTIQAVPVIGYKNQYSVRMLFPNNNPDFHRSPFVTIHKPVSDPDEFDGFIPLDSLDLRYSRSSGPGGQHVNKVNSKVELRVHIPSAEWIPARAKEKLMQNEKSRITKDWYLVLTSEKTRKQILNQADCLDKLRGIVRTACKKQYIPSDEEIQKMNKRKEDAKRFVLKEKRDRSQKKQYRSI